jgi:formate dehydrogenase maturation protein FdhE
MDRNDPEKNLGNEARDEQIFFCPTCASQPRLRVAILDTRKGSTVRMFACRCGEIVWDD